MIPYLLRSFLRFSGLKGIARPAIESLLPRNPFAIYNIKAKNADPAAGGHETLRSVERIF